MLRPLWKMIWQFLMKLNVYLCYDPATPLLNNYPKENGGGREKVMFHILIGFGSHRYINFSKLGTVH